MTEAQACYNEVVNEIDIPICENCLKFLDDPTHKTGFDVMTKPDGSDVCVPNGQCEEPARIECDSCGEIVKKKTAKQDKNEWWLCLDCAAEEGLS